MHTLIEMDGGVVAPKLIAAAKDNEVVSESRWRAAIQPAILLLRCAGDGKIYLPHPPGALAP